MMNLLVVSIIGYLFYGFCVGEVNRKENESFRLMTLLDWPWLIYTKGVTTA